MEQKISEASYVDPSLKFFIKTKLPNNKRLTWKKLGSKLDEKVKFKNCMKKYEKT